MSHGDHVEAAPDGFFGDATTSNAPVAAFEDARCLYGIRHPVHHPSTAPRCWRTSCTTCAEQPSWTMAGFRDATIAPEDELKSGVVRGAVRRRRLDVAAVLLREAVGRGSAASSWTRASCARRRAPGPRGVPAPRPPRRRRRRREAVFDGPRASSSPRRSAGSSGPLHRRSRRTQGRRRGRWRARDLYPDVIESVSIKAVGRHQDAPQRRRAAGERFRLVECSASCSCGGGGSARSPASRRRCS